MYIHTCNMADLLSSLLTPIIAVTTTMIAIVQFRLEKQKWRLALYDKRFETYRAVTEFLSLLCTQGRCEHADEIAYLQRASQNRFLFDQDIQEYIEEIYSQSVKRNHIQKEVDGAHSEMAGHLALQAAELSIWFGKQFKVAESKFAKYIAITER